MQLLLQFFGVVRRKFSCLPAGRQGRPIPNLLVHLNIIPFYYARVISVMKEKKLTILIDRPAEEVFKFTLNPENTPKWIDQIVKEETDETPSKLGTIYRNQRRDGHWNEYEMTAFEAGKMFVLSNKNGNYHVKYVFKPVSENSCELEYSEWVDKGQIEEPFTIEILQKLKSLIEDS